MEAPKPMNLAEHPLSPPADDRTDDPTPADAEPAATQPASAPPLHLPSAPPIELTVRELTAALEASRAEASTATLALSEATATANLSRAELKAAQRDLAEARASGLELSDRVGVLDAQLRTVRASLTDAQSAKRQLEDRLATMDREADEARAKQEARRKALEATGGWSEFDETQPMPGNGVDDPVVGIILQSYTGDPKRQAEVWAWLKSVATDKDLNRLKNKQLTLERTPKEARDGIMTMVVPLLQAREDVRVQVLLREHHEVRTDIRLVVVEDRTRTLPPASSGGTLRK